MTTLTPAQVSLLAEMLEAALRSAFEVSIASFASADLDPAELEDAISEIEGCIETERQRLFPLAIAILTGQTAVLLPRTIQ